jgi:phosphoribosylaminoimidazole-succinocarboxamide synthase
MPEVMIQAEGVPFPLFRRGKVRDLFDLGDELLMVATDRISVYDVILPTAIPRKGEVLNRLSRFWFQRTEGIVANHVSSRRLEEYLDDRELIAALEPRSMVVHKTEPLPFEDVIRGYLSGSAWAEYCESGTIGGIAYGAGLSESQELPEPFFTPTTKGEVGEHDESMSVEELAELIGEEMMERVKGLSVRIYSEAAAYARGRGIIIADTKFEFGTRDGELMIIDEVLTPDSSRFWPVDGYEPGHPQPSYDKQFVRDYVRSIGWKVDEPPPELPQDVVGNTTRLYQELYKKLTGETI